MRILYGVVGEGMGHATRSRVILEHLLAAGHQIRVVVSGRAHKFMLDKFKDRPNITIDEIHGFHLVYEDNELDKSASLWSNLTQVPKGLLKNIDAYFGLTKSFQADLVISDFETWAYLYALNHMIPVISIDNIQMLNRCHHADDVTDGGSFSYHFAKMTTKIKVPGAYHYLVSSFFYPPVSKPRTSLVPPILRPEILAAKREPGKHVLVYQTASTNSTLIPTLRNLPYNFKLYGMGRDGQEGNVQLCSFSEKGFVDDLRTAKAVIAGGGYSLMGEAVHLHVPMLSVPIVGQYEQELNARYLEKNGYGTFARQLDADTISEFLQNTDEMSQSLEKYVPRDNGMLFGCVDELIRLIGSKTPRPDALDPAVVETMGRYEE